MLIEKYQPKIVKSSYLNIDLDIPRDREGSFEPQVLKKYTHRAQVKKTYLT
uniref:transposase n=1 Tax=Peptoniphilus lacrimalis TaxID=33031 RepID=UPI002279AC15|nr:transposase [Peptoniphilus lacrimalis]